MKRCAVCKLEKSIDQFHLQTGARDGRQNRCKECACRLARQWHSENKEKAAEQKRAYFQNNKKAITEKNAQWQRDNAAKVAVYGKKYRDANIEKERERARKYREAHRAEALEYRRSYRARLPDLVNKWDADRRAKERGPSWSIDFFVREAFHLAKLRTKTTGIKWHVDHIVPLQNKTVCGLHAHTNIQVIPASVNQSKSNRYWPDKP